MRRGFTLIEVLTVITIIGILVSISTYAYTAAASRSRDSQRLADLEFIGNGLEQFYLDNRSYPSFQSYNDLYQAAWQLEGGYGCQQAGKKFLAPKYLTKIPNDPNYKFDLNQSAACSAELFGRYLYFGVPKATSKTGYYLGARMERSRNVNYTSTLGDALSQAGYSTDIVFCDMADFEANPTSCSQNYFVTNLPD